MFAFLTGIRIVHVADEKLVGVLIAGVVTLALNRLGGHALNMIIPAAVLELPNRSVLDIVAPWNDAASCLQDESIEAFFGEFFRRPSTGNSRADNDRVVGIGRHASLPMPFSQTPLARNRAV